MDTNHSLPNPGNFLQSEAAVQTSLLPVSYQHTCLKVLPLKETPAYRVAANADECSLLELLSVLVGGMDQLEIAERLLGRFGTIKRLSQAHAEEIAGVKGVGKQAALRLKAALALSRKLLQPEDERVSVHSPADAAGILSPLLAYREQEYLVILVLDTRHRVLDTVEIYHGSLNSSMVRIAELFKPAISRNAAAIIMSHNHPSGDPTPSQEDINLTRATVQAGKLMDIELLDHLVIGCGKFVSLKEKGLGFS